MSFLDNSSRLSRIETDLHEDSVHHRIVSKQLKQYEDALKSTRTLLVTTEKTRELLNTLVNHKKRTTLDKIEALVTHGLQTIFENKDYHFRIEAKHVRKQIAYSFVLSDGQHESGDLTSTRGGGVVNVVSFLLAVVVQLMLDPTARTFVLDEKFAHVSARFVPNISELLETLSVRTKIQFLVVSHQSDLVEAADTAYELHKGSDGATKIKRIK